MDNNNELQTLQTHKLPTSLNSLECELELDARNIRAIRRHAERQIPKFKVTSNKKSVTVTESIKRHQLTGQYYKFHQPTHRTIFQAQDQQYHQQHQSSNHQHLQSQ